jgi:hypothetical protein
VTKKSIKRDLPVSTVVMTGLDFSLFSVVPDESVSLLLTNAGDRGDGRQVINVFLAVADCFNKDFELFVTVTEIFGIRSIMPCNNT